MDLWAEPEWLDLTCFSPLKSGNTCSQNEIDNAFETCRLLRAGVETPGAGSGLGDEECAAYHREVFHEHDELQLVHRGVGDVPEVVHHWSDRGEEEHDEPRADSGVVAENDREASG